MVALVNTGDDLKQSDQIHHLLMHPNFLCFCHSMTYWCTLTFYRHSITYWWTRTFCVSAIPTLKMSTHFPNKWVMHLSLFVCFSCSSNEWCNPAFCLFQLFQQWMMHPSLFVCFSCSSNEWCTPAFCLFQLFQQWMMHPRFLFASAVPAMNDAPQLFVWFSCSSNEWCTPAFCFSCSNNEWYTPAFLFVSVVPTMSYALLLFSPWYNHNAWLGVKHQVTTYPSFFSFVSTIPAMSDAPQLFLKFVATVPTMNDALQFFCFSRSNNSNCPCCPPIPRPRCPTSSTSLRPSKSHALTITCPTSDWWATGCSDPTPTRAYVHMVQTSFIPSSFSCCPRRPFSAPLPPTPTPQLQILDHILLVKETHWTGEEYTQQERERERSTLTQRKRKIFLQQERSTLQEEKEKFLHNWREMQ